MPAFAAPAPATPRGRAHAVLLRRLPPRTRRRPPRAPPRAALFPQLWGAPDETAPADAGRAPPPGDEGRQETPPPLQAPPPDEDRALHRDHPVAPPPTSLAVDVNEPPWTPGRVWLEQPAVPAVIVAVGTLVMRPLARELVPFVATLAGTRRIDALLTGSFCPAVGVLFGMLSSTAVVTLRQRQENVRNILNLELATARLLTALVHDARVISLLLEYARALDAETFSHRANGVVYHQRSCMSAEESDRREALFAYADDLLYAAVARVNSLRLRGDLEAEMRQLVSLRSQRRATLDTNFPTQYYNIIAVLGASILLSFLLLLAGDPSWIDVPAVTWIWAILLGVLTSGAILIADLRDPFRGNYRLSRARMRRTLSLLSTVLRSLRTAEKNGRV